MLDHLSVSQKENIGGATRQTSLLQVELQRGEKVQVHFRKFSMNIQLRNLGNTGIPNCKLFIVTGGNKLKRQ